MPIKCKINKSFLFVKVGLREAGLQNQGDDEAVTQCPYKFRTTWEYADIEQPGWQWVYDYTAR